MLNIFVKNSSSENLAPRCRKIEDRLGEATTFLDLAEQAGESRIWGGIHYRSDIVGGAQLGQDVANKVIGIAEQDGSQ